MPRPPETPPDQPSAPRLSHALKPWSLFLSLSQGHSGLLASLPELASLLAVNWSVKGQQRSQRPKGPAPCALDMPTEWPRGDGHTGSQHCLEQSLPTWPPRTLDFLRPSCPRTGCGAGHGFLRHHRGQQSRVMAQTLDGASGDLSSSTSSAQAAWSKSLPSLGLGLPICTKGSLLYTSVQKDVTFKSLQH